MAIGVAVTQAEVNNAAAVCARSVYAAFQNIKAFEAYLAGTADATLTAMGFSVGEVATLKSAFVDLDQLRTVFEGTATRTPAYDYRAFVKQLIGVGII